MLSQIHGTPYISGMCCEIIFKGIALNVTSENLSHPHHPLIPDVTELETIFTTVSLFDWREKQR